MGVCKKRSMSEVIQMAEYLELEKVLDDKNIITVQTKEYGSIDVIPVDTIIDIELSDVQPVKRGRWLPAKGWFMSKCSECGYELGAVLTAGYICCPKCTARMDGENK